MKVNDFVSWTGEASPESIGMIGVIREVCDDGMYRIEWSDGHEDYWYPDCFALEDTDGEPA